MKSIWDGIEHWNTICHCCRYLPNICFRYYMSLWAITEQFSRTGTTSSHSCNYDWDIYKMFFGVCEFGLIQICISQSELWYILAFIATQLFWPLSGCKTSIILLVLLGTNPCLPPLAFILCKSRARFAGRHPIKWELHWHRRAETTNDNRLARLPRPSASKVVPGRLSLTSKIVVQEDINLKKPARCWCRGWLCQLASLDHPQIRSFRLYTKRQKILKRSNTWCTSSSSTMMKFHVV